MLTPLALVLEHPAATHHLPGMILQSSLFLVSVEGLQCAKLRLSTSVHAMTFHSPGALGFNPEINSTKMIFSRIIPEYFKNNILIVHKFCVC